jgi:hypothetical protein
MGGGNNSPFHIGVLGKLEKLNLKLAQVMKRISI